MKNPLKLLYLSIGILTVLIFLATGQYLKHQFPNKEGMDLAFRVMQRSRHIFILLSGLTLSGIGIYFQYARTRLFVTLQYIAFSLLFIANALFVYAFFYEVETLFIPKTPVLHYAAYLVLGGVFLNFVSTFRGVREYFVVRISRFAD